MSRISSTIWVASSRVGASTSAAGRGSLAPMRSTTGIPKASVLPEPVGDFAITSRPAIASPITARWISNGSVIPAADNERVTALETPRPAKEPVDICNSLAAQRGRERFGRRRLPEPLKAEPKQAASRPTGPTAPPAHTNVAGHLTASSRDASQEAPLHALEPVQLRAFGADGGLDTRLC